ncbi:MAG: gamma-glutamyltransferase, partial [Moorea sp. SIO3I7]|nr:gamma-glutamyltransferase [Moorena sp. SIO3I7]
SQVLLEQSVPRHIALELAEMGHDIQVMADSINFGKGQVIWRQSGVLVAASEPRGDGLALVG